MCHIDLSNKWLIFRSYFDTKQFSLKFFSQFCSKRRSHIARKVARPLGSVSCKLSRFQRLTWCWTAFNWLSPQMRDPLPFLTWSVIGERNNRWCNTNNTPFNPDSNIRHMPQGQVKMEVRESYRITVEIRSKPMLNCWGIFCLVVRIVIPSKITSKNVINN